MIKQSYGDRIFNTIILFLATLAAIIVLYPLIYIVSCSFSEPALVANGSVWLLPKGFNIMGYKRVFQDENIMTGYANTIFYTITGTLINLAVTLPAGYAMSKPQLPGRKIIMTYFMITMYFGGGMIPTYMLIKKLNLLNTRFIIIILGAISIYNLIICRTFFKSMPSELEEAAYIDGCSQAKTFVQIILPLSKALIGVMTLYYGISHWNSYFSAMIYISDNSKKPLQLFLRQILVIQQTSANMMADMGSDEARLEAEKLMHLLKFSTIIVSSAPVLIIYPFLQKYFDKGVLLGSIKG